MPPAIELTAVRKDYRGLRPLRIRDLAVSEGEVVALGGLDEAAAEVLTNLITGATLPDEGSVRVFGEDTAAMADGDAWLTSLDRFGIVSDRVALVEAFTLRQNIAIALTLDLEPLNDDVAAKVGALAAEAGLAEAALDVATAVVPPPARFRARLARAVATSPRILLAEHPTLSVPRPDVAGVASDFFRLVRGRHLAVLITSVDRDFVGGCDRCEMLDPATGGFKSRGLRGWFSREA
jgi:predicted ABC-type transport system involved in lysophospholipase L1 biosynthesis ATPase subunit